MTEQTEREFLVSKGLAKPSRGRFSKEAQAALADARQRGMKFAAAVQKKPAVDKSNEAPKEKKASKPRPADLPAVDPKAVRAWAKANGKEVGDRGRIDTNVVQEYIAAAEVTGTKTEDLAPAIPASQDFRPAAERWRKADNWVAIDTDGSKIKKSYTDTCNGCGYSIGWCGCENGPVAFGNDTVTVLKLTPAS